MQKCLRRQPSVRARHGYLLYALLATAGCSTDLSIGEMLVRPDAGAHGGSGPDASLGPIDGSLGPIDGSLGPIEGSLGPTEGSVDAAGATLDHVRGADDDRAESSDGASCLLAHAPCARPDECCSHFCLAGSCFDPGICQGSGTSCTQSSACCSSRCEPGTAITNLVCQTLCSADGVSCTKAQDCCSLGCFNGVCGGGLCRSHEAACSRNSDCCSNICATSGDCELVGDDIGACQPAGENCAADAGIICCNGCDTTVGRCRLPPTTCHGLGATCASDGDCCKGKCLLNGQNQLACRIPCLADGNACTTTAECCSFGCSGSPPRCGPPAGAAEAGTGGACRSTGQGCTTNLECCSHSCADGFCDLPCQLAGVRCRVNSDCCSNVCASNLCQPP